METYLNNEKNYQYINNFYKNISIWTTHLVEVARTVSLGRSPLHRHCTATVYHSRLRWYMYQNSLPPSSTVFVVIAVGVPVETRWATSLEFSTVFWLREVPLLFTKSVVLLKTWAKSLLLLYCWDHAMSLLAVVLLEPGWISSTVALLK